jgi:hypothetical protein
MVSITEAWQCKPVIRFLKTVVHFVRFYYLPDKKKPQPFVKHEVGTLFEEFFY